MSTLTHDILIIGAGLAGQRAAIEARKQNMDVGIISKVHPVRSHSVAAAGGINAAIGEGDDWKAHFRDTVYGSDFLADQDAVKILCQDAPSRVKEMESWGVVFSRTNKGEIAQRPFGGQSVARTCYASDRTGHMLLHTTYDQLMKTRPTIYSEHYALSLITENNHCAGAVVWDMEKGKIISMRANAVLLATGGYGRAFSVTTNARICTGDGLSLAYNAGLPLEDMEFVQFHPSGMYGKGFLVSEASRGEGAYLLNSKNERFMKKYAPQKMELASRDIIARAIMSEIAHGRGCGSQKDHVYLDVRHLGEKKIIERIPEIRKTVHEQLGMDCVKELIPIIPTAHYSMGGVPTNVHTQVIVDAHNNPFPGLYAAGEVSCLSVHGANRLGGNSLLETIVFGRIAGQKMAEHVRENTRNKGSVDFSHHEEKARARVDELLTSVKGTKSHVLRTKLQQLMMENVGVYRSKTGLTSAQRAWKKLSTESKAIHVEDKSPTFNMDLIHALECQNLVTFSQSIIASALARTETRGSHARTDYPARNDQKWLKHSMAVQHGENVQLFYKPVIIAGYAPEARHY
ncbi:MAG: FAD-binding protein [Candidatus Diapherotrites archaeon]|uniref:succinate dehydrogenase n=1 Tax=Candidatus Iainarchaeum sp. TaxID=3101447 RepID=A0A8T4C5Y4_9ARCH|nr:FAD-binding protein [Candidatus Diapherotrites archaeon]